VTDGHNLGHNQNTNTNTNVITGTAPGAVVNAADSCKYNMWSNQLTTTHMPHGITQCYLPLSTADIPAFTPTNCSWFSDSGGMQGWVDL